MKPDYTDNVEALSRERHAWRQSVVVILASLLVLGLAFITKSPYWAYMVYAFLLLAIVAYITSSLWLVGLECKRSVDRLQLLPGEDVNVNVCITNRRGWPIPWIYIEDFYPKDFLCKGSPRRLAILMPGQSVTLTYKLTCTRRGYHRIGPVVYESGDLFGLHKRFRTGETRDYISVLPTVAYVETFNVMSRRPQGPVRVTNRIYSDPTRISNIREYVPGDPLNTIHWKASAKTGSLHVKTFEPTSISGGTLILDLHENSYVAEKRESRMELAITTAASIAYLLQMSGEQIGLLTNARDAAEEAQYIAASAHARSRYELTDLMAEETQPLRISPLTVPTRRSAEQGQKIIENLARVLPGHGLDLPALILAHFITLPRDATLLAITGQVTDRLALTLALMKQSGFNVVVFLIDAGAAASDSAARLLASYNIFMFHVESERHLHEINPRLI